MPEEPYFPPAPIYPSTPNLAHAGRPLWPHSARLRHSGSCGATSTRRSPARPSMTRCRMKPMTNSCPDCGAASPDVLDVLPDQRRRLSCRRCDHVWVDGEAQPMPTSRLGHPRPVRSYLDTKAGFPTPDQVKPSRLARVATLKARFLSEHPTP